MAAPTGQWGLRRFFAAYVAPVLLIPARRSPATIAAYRESLWYWHAITGDPPLAALAADELAGRSTHCVDFAARLADMPARGGGRLVPATIRKHCAAINRLLRLAGPRESTTDGRADLYGWHAVPTVAGRTVDERRPVPLVVVPSADRREPRGGLDDDDFAALLDACRRPPAPGGRSAAWWRSLFVWIDATGTRIAHTVQVGRGMISDNVLDSPAAICKGRRKRPAIYVPDHAIAAVDAIAEPGDGRLFPWPAASLATQLRGVHRGRVAIQAAAGIEAPGVGFHALRRRAACRIAERNPDAARRQLGHAAMTTTFGGYAGAQTLRAFVEPETTARKERA